jgi:hypothetical protein
MYVLVFDTLLGITSSSVSFPVHDSLSSCAAMTKSQLQHVFVVGVLFISMHVQPLNGFITQLKPTACVRSAMLDLYNKFQFNDDANKFFGDPFPSTTTTTTTYSTEEQPSSTATENFFWTDPVDNFNIIVHIRQQLFPEEDFDTVARRVTIIDNHLPLVTIDGFLEDSTCQEIILAAESTGDMKRSTMGNSQKVSTSRTSSTTWMRPEDCDGSAVDLLNERASRLADIPHRNFESLQVVKYDGNGQKFDMHTDHMNSFNDLECFGRLATCLVYLNSASEGFDDKFTGGATFFPEYEAYVKPKRGRGVFWFNTIERPGMADYAPGALHADLRSRHTGTPVYNGSKYVCNLWMHPIALK